MTDYKDNFTVIVRLPEGLSFELSVNKDWDVEQLKQAICSQSNHDASLGEISVLFQGKVLQGAEPIKCLDLGDFSYLHVVKAKKPPPPSHPRTDQGEQLDSLSDEVYLKSNYFVYCKTSCQRVCPAKLRVRCASCREATFVVERGPNQWSDVLEKHQIAGICHTENCRGQTAEFYFKCAGHRTEEAEMSIPLPLIQRNEQNVECLSCGDISAEVLVFECVGRHSICLDCFTEYGNVSLCNRDFINTEEYGFTFGCPNKCENSYLKEAHYFRILGDAAYERYQRFATEACILQSGGVLCPSPGCTNAFLLENNLELDDVLCDYCNLSFCIHCRLPSHPGPCSIATAFTASAFTVDPLRAEMARWDREAKEKIQEISKPCPKCKAPTEKSEGCNHMTCAALDPRTGEKCLYQWCWVCVKEWSRLCQSTHWFANI